MWDRQRRAVLLEEGVCRYCGMILVLDGKPIPHVATVDHIKPKVQGGTDDRDNLAACCRGCQQRKAAHEGGKGVDFFKKPPDQDRVPSLAHALAKRES